MFSIDPETITVESLEERSQQACYILLKELLQKIESGSKLPHIVQENGNYYSREDFEKAKIVTLNMTKDEINKKIQAFWYPPYEGAYIELDGERYTLVNQTILNSINLDKR